MVEEHSGRAGMWSDKGMVAVLADALVCADVITQCVTHCCQNLSCVLLLLAARHLW
jgi:hypothetical protein